MRVLHAGAGLLLATAAGCLPIPHRHLMQPAVAFRVADAERQPVSGATVRLYATYSVGEDVAGTTSAATDRAGRASFPEVREWHPFTYLMIDSDPPLHWGWCVDAPGFRPAVGVAFGDTRPELLVTLERSYAAARCPERPQTLDEVGRITFTREGVLLLPHDSTGTTP